MADEQKQEQAEPETGKDYKALYEQSQKQLEAAHLSEDLIRLSVGIEDVDDIIADLDQALAKI